MAHFFIPSSTTTTSMSSDTGSSSSNSESDTDGPLSRSSSTNSFSDTYLSDSSEDEPPRILSPQVENDVMKRCIYPGAKVTYSESLLLLLRYALVYALTKRGLEDLLRLMALFLPSVENPILPSSVYVLKRSFVASFPSVPVRKVIYCNSCQALLDGRSCGKRSCSGDVKDFVFISPSQQIKLKLEGK